MKNWIIGRNKSYYDIFYGEQFNHKDFYNPLTSSNWKSYDIAKNGYPPTLDMELPQKTIAVIKGVHKNFPQLYMGVRKWIIQNELYDALKPYLPVCEVSNLSLYNYSGTIGRTDYRLVRINIDNIDDIDIEESDIEESNSSIPKIRIKTYKSIVLKKDLELFTLCRQQIYQSVLFCNENIEHLILSHCKDIEFYSLEGYVSFFKQKYHGVFAKK